MRKCCQEAGISLVELMIGTVIVITMLGGILSLCLQHARQRRIDAELHLAFVACRNNLEELRSVPFSDLPSLDGRGFDVPASDGSPGGLRPV
ncbi:MAG: hypothetical protein ACE5F1_02375, partial [Planctomycetota bacterium]